MTQAHVKRKILMLHGYGQSAYVMSRLMASTIKECDDDLQFFFLDAPKIMDPCDPVHEFGFPAAIRPVLSPSIPQSTCLKPTLSPRPGAPRGWFTMLHRGRSIMKAPGIEKSMLLLKDVLRENRFEAICGFSQGAAMAELLASMLERPHLYPDFFERGETPHPPLRFIVTVSGFLLRGGSELRSWDKLLPTVIDPDPSLILETPVLHIVGRTDVVVPRERSNIFIAFSRNKRVEEHIGGHFIPTKRRWRKFFAEFFRDPFGPILSPSPPRQEEPLRPLPPRYYCIGETLCVPKSGHVAEQKLLDLVRKINIKTGRTSFMPH